MGATKISGFTGIVIFYASILAFYLQDQYHKIMTEVAVAPEPAPAPLPTATKQEIPVSQSQQTAPDQQHVNVPTPQPKATDSSRNDLPPAGPVPEKDDGSPEDLAEDPRRKNAQAVHDAQELIEAHKSELLSDPKLKEIVEKALLFDGGEMSTAEVTQGLECILDSLVVIKNDPKAMELFAELRKHLKVQIPGEENLYTASEIDNLPPDLQEKLRKEGRYVYDFPKEESAAQSKAGDLIDQKLQEFKDMPVKSENQKRVLNELIIASEARARNAAGVLLWDDKALRDLDILDKKAGALKIADKLVKEVAKARVKMHDILRDNGWNDGDLVGINETIRKNGLASIARPEMLRDVVGLKDFLFGRNAKGEEISDKEIRVLLDPDGNKKEMPLILVILSIMSSELVKETVEPLVAIAG
ncbi:MAG: hypothetical protein Q7K29_04150 [Thermoleophilia bacterium]|nr:hypothetical protein [Thermoleophilia bacterium]